MTYPESIALEEASLLGVMTVQDMTVNQGFSPSSFLVLCPHILLCFPLHLPLSLSSLPNLEGFQPFNNEWRRYHKPEVTPRGRRGAETPNATTYLSSGAVLALLLISYKFWSKFLHLSNPLLFVWK